MGVPLDLPPLEILRAWKEKSARAKLIPPRVVATGEITENVLDGDAADLERFPAPRWHQRDGGRYIGTADMVINKDPDTGWVNVGTYRACIHGPRRLSLWMNPDRDGRYIAQKYWSQGRACPVAVVLGADPTSWMASPVKLSRGVANSTTWVRCTASRSRCSTERAHRAPDPGARRDRRRRRDPAGRGGVGARGSVRRMARLLHAHRPRVRRAGEAHHVP